VREAAWTLETGFDGARWLRLLAVALATGGCAVLKDVEE
jgi:hypothetical protein